jgi:hypothetical protein
VTKSAFIPEAKILSFSGYVWLVKNNETRVGPGLNYFSDSNENAWVDEQGSLHLKITKRNNKWYCSELISEKSFGYGKYVFYLESKIDQLNERVVIGLFVLDESPKYNHNEIDIELSRWGWPINNNAQFVVQPYTNSKNIYRFNIQQNSECATYSFEWKNKNIFFQSLDSNEIIQSWNYTGKNIPIPHNEKTRINLWLFKGNPPSDNEEVEIIIKKFEFIPQNK